MSREYVGIDLHRRRRRCGLCEAAPVMGPWRGRPRRCVLAVGRRVPGAAVDRRLRAFRRGSRHSRPLFARFYAVLSRRAERGELGERRRAVLAGARGRVLDLGAGPGDTFRHLSGPVTDIVALEPDPGMVRLALPRLAEGIAPVHLVRAVGERLPFPDEVFDTVVVTLVLCSVDDPHAVASEVHRVLRRGGRLLLLEHVRSADEALARWQDRLQPLCSLCNGGCHPNRPTLDTIRGAGLRIGSLRAYGFPVLPYVEGEAFRD